MQVEGTANHRLQEAEQRWEGRRHAACSWKGRKDSATLALELSLCSTSSGRKLHSQVMGKTQNTVELNVQIQ